jgi:FkbM family methyltransferase
MLKKIIENSIVNFASRLPLNINQKSVMASYAHHFRDKKAGITDVKDGFLMDLDLSLWNNRMIAYGLYEKETVEFLKKNLKFGDHFIDVGANIGYFSLIGRNLVGKNGRVDSFEPIDETFCALKGNIALNYDQRKDLDINIFLHNMAVGEVQSELSLQIYSHTSTLTSVFDRGTNVGKSTQIKTMQIRLDEYLKNTNPNVIKIDVEGWEAQVIQGAEKFLKTINPPFIIFEHATEWEIYKEKGYINPFETILSLNKNYQFFALENNFDRIKIVNRLPEFNSGNFVGNVAVVPP